MTGQTRRGTLRTQTKPNDIARQCREMQLPVINVSTPGIVGLTVPIVLPLALLAILLAANLSLGEPRGDSRMLGTPVAQQSLDALRLAK